MRLGIGQVHPFHRCRSGTHVKRWLGPKIRYDAPMLVWRMRWTADGAKVRRRTENFPLKDSTRKDLAKIVLVSDVLFGVKPVNVRGF